LLHLLAVQNSELYFRATTKIMHVSHSKMPHIIMSQYCLLFLFYILL